MIELSVTKFSRNLRKIFNRIEHHREEVVLVRNKHKIARIIPGYSHLTATEVLGDLYKTIDEEAAKNWLEESRLKNTLESELGANWES